MPVTPTYVLLNQITLAASSSSVTFSNIPQNYSDLIVLGRYQVSSNYTQPSYRLNADTGSNYFSTTMSGKSWSPTAFAYSASSIDHGTLFFTGGNTGSRIWFTLNIFDYSAIDKHKTGLVRTNYISSSEDATVAIATRWANTSPVTSINIFAGPTYTVPFASGSTFYLYGLVA